MTIYGKTDDFIFCLILLYITPFKFMVFNLDEDIVLLYEIWTELITAIKILYP